MLVFNPHIDENKRRIAIVNFNENSTSLIDELLLELRYMKQDKLELHLFANSKDIELPEYDDERLSVSLYKCNILETEIRKCMHLGTLETAVILCDRQKGDYADYYTILLSKYLAKCNPDIHIIVELQKSENIRHLGHTNVADVICIEELSEKLLSKSAIVHGFSKFYMHLLYNTLETNSIFTIDLPESLIGESFRFAEELLCDFRQDMILIGYVTHLANRERDFIVINPEKGKLDSPDGKEYRFKRDDRLVIIGYENPDLSEIERQKHFLKAA